MRRLRVFLFVLLATALGGCWDVYHIDRRGFVFALGIDRDTKGTIVVSARVARGSSRDGNAAENGPVLTSRGRSVGECMERLAGLSDRRLDWGNLRTIILGERAARGGVAELLLAPLNAPRVPGDLVLLQARGRAVDVISWTPPGEDLPQTYFDNLYAKAGSEGVAPVLIPAWQAKSRLDNPGRDLFLGGIMRQGKTVVARDVALYRGDRLAGWLGTSRAKAFQWTRGKGGGYVLTADPDSPRQTAVVRVRKARSHLRIARGQPLRLVISLSVEGEIVEAGGGALSQAPGYAERLRRAAEDQIRRHVRDLAKYVQQTIGSDAWGFGELIRRSGTLGRPEKSGGREWSEALWDVHVDLRMVHRGRYKLCSFCGKLLPSYGSRGRIKTSSKNVWASTGSSAPSAALPSPQSQAGRRRANLRPTRLCEEDHRVPRQDFSVP